MLNNSLIKLCASPPRYKIDQHLKYSLGPLKTLNIKIPLLLAILAYAPNQNIAFLNLQTLEKYFFVQKIVHPMAKFQSFSCSQDIQHQIILTFDNYLRLYQF